MKQKKPGPYDSTLAAAAKNDLTEESVRAWIKQLRCCPFCGASDCRRINPMSCIRCETPEQRAHRLAREQAYVYGIKVVADPTMPPDVAELRGANTVRIENIKPSDLIKTDDPGEMLFSTAHPTGLEVAEDADIGEAAVEDFEHDFAELAKDIEADATSRAGWYRTYNEGIKLLGVAAGSGAVPAGDLLHAAIDAELYQNVEARLLPGPLHPRCSEHPDETWQAPNDSWRFCGHNGCEWTWKPGTVDVLAVTRDIARGCLMAVTEYQWIGDDKKPDAVADGFEPVRADELPALADPDNEFIGNGDVWLYKRKVGE